MTIRIIHLTTFLQGGAGKVIIDLIDSQLKAGYEVECFSNKTCYPGYLSYPEYERALERMGVRHVKLEGLFKREHSLQVSASKQLAEYIGECRNTVIHSHAAIPSLLGLLLNETRETPVPVIQTMHGWGTNKSIAQSSQDIAILNRLNRVITVSEASRNFLLTQGVSPKRLTCIYNGIAPKNTFRSKDFQFGAKEHKQALKLVCVGSVCERKNQAMLVKAVERLINDGANIACYFFGELEGEYADQLLSYVKTHNLADCIRFKGAIEGVSDIIGQFDLMVLPSKAEGLPISLIEAFRERVLVLSSNIAECQELVTDKVNGLTFELASLDNLVAKLRYAMNLSDVQVKCMLASAYHRFEDGFALESMFLEYIALYEQVLAGK